MDGCHILEQRIEVPTSYKLDGTSSKVLTK